jgi:hypothetical protein
VGWYLVVPPVDRYSPEFVLVGLLSPLSEWDIVKGFDSAPDCHEAQNELVADFETQKWEPDVSEGEQGLIGASESAKCVASDDPRLAKQKSKSGDDQSKARPTAVVTIPIVVLAAVLSSAVENPHILRRTIWHAS